MLTDFKIYHGFWYQLDNADLHDFYVQVNRYTNIINKIKVEDFAKNCKCIAWNMQEQSIII